MTYQNDPPKDFNRPSYDMEGRRIDRREGWGTGSVVLASLAALAVVFGLFYAMSNRSDTNLARTDRPAVTTPATTTGSGAANRVPGDETGRRAEPQKVPAPATPPATNR